MPRWLQHRKSNILVEATRRCGAASPSLLIDLKRDPPAVLRLNSALQSDNTLLHRAGASEEERREMPASFPDHNLMQHRRLHPRPALDGRMTNKTTSVGFWHKLIGEWISIIIIIVWRDQHEKEEPSCHEWSYWATQLLRVLFAKNHQSSINAASCTPLLEPFPVVIGRTHRKTNKYFTLTHVQTI